MPSSGARRASRMRDEDFFATSGRLVLATQQRYRDRGRIWVVQVRRWTRCALWWLLQVVGVSDGTRTEGRNARKKRRTW